MIKSLDSLPAENIENIFTTDENGRCINIFKIDNCIVTGVSLFYPNPILYHKDSDQFYNPIREKIMSFDNIETETSYLKIESEYILSNPVFYFIYNTDNYYHFIYDTLPYLISYFKLKSKIPSLKLLMNYPNHSKNEFYKFVEEFLELLEIKKEDILICNNSTIYKEVYISSSYTHDIDSNLPPRKEIYEFYKNLVDKVKSKYEIKDLPKKIYISRRTWIHNNFSNIGTNYTTRRKLENEDELVEYLEKNGYKEIFTENLSTIEKILLFNNCTHVIGPIGGGICNVLFSNKNCKLITILSPIFLDVNKRFKFCLDVVDNNYFTDSSHTEVDKFKKWMRVKYQNIIGEIEEIYEDKIKIKYTEEKVAGWNSEFKLKDIIVRKDDCEILDYGLNSSWKINLKKLKEII